MLKKIDKGQAYIEYIIVCMVLITALLARSPEGDLYLSKIISAVKAQYKGYAHAISMTEMPACMDQNSIQDDIKQCLNQ